VDRAFGTSLRIQTGGRASAYSTTTRVGDAFGGDVDTDIGDLSGEVGAIWTLSPEWRISGRFAQAFRAPNIYDLTLIGEIPGGFSLPSAELRAENSHTIDAAARFERGRFRAEATLFRVRIDDMIDRVLDVGAEPPPDVPPDTRILRVRNVGHALIHGVEGGMSISVPGGPLEGLRLSLSGAWTYGNARVVRDGEPLDEPLGRVPPPSVTTRLRLPFSLGRLGGPAGGGQGSLAPEREGGVEHFFMAAAAQERLGFRDVLDSRIRPGGTPAYQVHALRAFLQLTEGARMSVSLENVFDRLYRAHGSGIDSAGRHLLVRLDVLR
jgi:hemoglobin/transferrin/lactoferrin receptor protein